MNEDLAMDRGRNDLYRNNLHESVGFLIIFFVYCEFLYLELRGYHTFTGIIFEH